MIRKNSAGCLFRGLVIFPVHDHRLLESVYARAPLYNNISFSFHTYKLHIFSPGAPILSKTHMNK
ncbi:hypothetical protein I7I48_11832 [Histoplasma ohiense]|nr:hypothetical protein I7I48_11832 [Histoplasma ohiense (nom. inval.)]